MNIEIYKKHLIGKQIAFSYWNLSKVYRGEISDVIETSFMNNSSLLIKVVSANFGYVRVALPFGEGVVYCFSEIGEDSLWTMFTSEPIIDGVFPFRDFVRGVIIPEVEEINSTDVMDLIRRTGTFTGCKELMERFLTEGLLRKDGATLYVSMGISIHPGCVCGLARTIDRIESLTRDLKKFFDVDEVVYYDVKNGEPDDLTFLEVEPGTKGRNPDICNNYPVIKGLGMRWKILEEK